MRTERVIMLAEQFGVDAEKLTKGPYELALMSAIDGSPEWEADKLCRFLAEMPEGTADWELVVGELNATLYCTPKPQRFVHELAGFCDAIILTNHLKTQLYNEAGHVCGEDWRILAHAEQWIEDAAVKERKGE